MLQRQDDEGRTFQRVRGDRSSSERTPPPAASANCNGASAGVVRFPIAVPPKSETRVYRFGPFELDTAEQLLTHNGKKVAVTPKAYDTLLLFLSKPKVVIEKHELLRALWPNTFVQEGSLTQTICGLRKALGEKESGAEYIEMIPRRGYRFAVEVEEDGPSVEGIRYRAANCANSTADLAPTPNRWRKLTRPAAITCVLATLVGGGLFALANRSGAHWSQPKTLAILPFQSLAGALDPSLQLGLADTLSTRLSQSRRFTLSTTRAVARYTGTNIDPLRVCRELTADAVLDGAVQRAGGRLRVSAKLIDCRTGIPLWADILDISFSDSLAVQDEFAHRIASSLVRIAE